MKTGQGTRDSHFRNGSVYSTDYNCAAEGKDLM